MDRTLRPIIPRPLESPVFDLSAGLSRSSIVRLFPERHQRHVHVPELESVNWSQFDYFGWVDAQTRTGYMVAPYRGNIVGVVLDPTKSTQRNETQCDLCGVVHNPGHACLYTAGTINPRIRIGRIICADLCCSEYLRGTRNPTKLQPIRSTDPTNGLFNLQMNLESFLDQIYRPKPTEVSGKVYEGHK